LFRAPLAAGTLEPLRVRAACWVPDLRQSAWPKLARAITQEALQYTLDWEKCHTTLTGQGIEKFKRPTKAEQRKRRCLDAGRCLCSPPRERRGLHAILQSLNAALKKFMGPGSRKKGVSANRKALEDASVIMRFIGSRPAPSRATPEDTRWLHVPLLYLEPLRPTFLQLYEHSTIQDDQSRSFTVAHKPGTDHAWWQTLWEALESMPIDVI